MQRIMKLNEQTFSVIYEKSMQKPKKVKRI